MKLVIIILGVICITPFANAQDAVDQYYYGYDRRFYSRDFDQPKRDQYEQGRNDFNYNISRQIEGDPLNDVLNDIRQMDQQHYENMRRDRNRIIFGD